MKITIKQLKQLIKERVEETVGSAADEDEVPARPSGKPNWSWQQDRSAPGETIGKTLTSMLDELIQEVGRLEGLDFSVDEDNYNLVSIKTKILNYVQTKLDASKQGR